MRQGWLGDAPRNRRESERKYHRAEPIAARFAEMRLRMGLLIPYGEKASSTSPARRSRRRRGERRGPPGQTQLDIPA